MGIKMKNINQKYILGVLKDIHNQRPMIISEHDTFEDAIRYEGFLRAQKFQSPIEIFLIEKPLVVFQIDFAINHEEKTFSCWKEMIKCYSVQQNNNMQNVNVTKVTKNRMHATVVQNVDSISLEEAINTASREINKITGYIYVDKGDQKNVCFELMLAG